MISITNKKKICFTDVCPLNNEHIFVKDSVMNLSRPVLINAKAMALSSHGFKASFDFV